jgi:glycerol-3-phosphate dehydrogenase
MLGWMIANSATARADIVETFAGIRPLVKSASDPNTARRDYAFSATAGY